MLVLNYCDDDSLSPQFHNPVKLIPVPANFRAFGQTKLQRSDLGQTEDVDEIRSGKFGGNG